MDGSTHACESSVDVAGDARVGAVFVFEGSVFKKVPVRVGLSAEVAVVLRAVTRASRVVFAADGGDVFDGAVPRLLDADHVVVVAMFL